MLVINRAIVIKRLMLVYISNCSWIGLITIEIISKCFTVVVHAGIHLVGLCVLFHVCKQLSMDEGTKVRKYIVRK